MYVFNNENIMPQKKSISCFALFCFPLLPVSLLMPFPVTPNMTMHGASAPTSPHQFRPSHHHAIKNPISSPTICIPFCFAPSNLSLETADDLSSPLFGDAFTSWETANKPVTLATKFKDLLSAHPSLPNAADELMALPR